MPTSLRQRPSRQNWTHAPASSPCSPSTTSWRPSSFTCRATLLRLKRGCGHWKGPTTVVLVKGDPQQKPTVYWLIHGSALIRAAPEHVRPDPESAALATSPRSLHELVQDVQNRGTTIYSDLIRTNRKRPRSDADLLTDDEAVSPTTWTQMLTPGCPDLLCRPLRQLLQRPFCPAPSRGSRLTLYTNVRARGRGHITATRVMTSVWTTFPSTT